MKTPISILNLATYPDEKNIRYAFETTLDLAQKAEAWGYHRYWLAEHHNIEGIASAATAVLIAYVAGGTQKIRVGSGGIMLPNHSPLIVAEQFGTLETLYPGRIDLGLGRAPGTDPRTMRAIRGGAAMNADDFPAMINELLHYFKPSVKEQKIKAIPGAGIDVPIWILGSSLFSAHLAAEMGRPYAFAAHFAPQLLEEAAHIYRSHFKPSEVLTKPHLMVGTQVVAADTEKDAHLLATTAYQNFLGLIRRDYKRDPRPVDNMDELWNPIEKRQVLSMLRTMIIGDANGVRTQTEALIQQTGADELIFMTSMHDHKDRLRSYEIVAQALGL